MYIHVYNIYIWFKIDTKSSFTQHPFTVNKSLVAVSSWWLLMKSKCCNSTGSNDPTTPLTYTQSRKSKSPGQLATVARFRHGRT